MNTAILMIAHGAPESEGKDCATINAEKVRKATGIPTYVGYLHLEPSIKDAIGRMADDGVEQIMAIPLFITPGGLLDVILRKDFGFDPGVTAGTVECSGRSIGIRFLGTFGTHPKMADVLRGVCERNGATPSDTDVMLIFHGSRKEGRDENADICIGYLDSMGFEAITAYNEFQHPTVEEALEVLRSKEKDILVIPMFVSPGSHTTEDIPPKLGLTEGRSRIFDAEGRGIRLTYEQEIGMDDGIIDILLEMIRAQ